VNAGTGQDGRGKATGWRESLRLYDALAPAEHPHRLKTLGQLANVLRTRAPTEAVSIGREVVAATERRFPAGHTDLAQARAQLAFALLELEGGAVDAEAEFRAVVALRGRLQGETSRAAAGARVDLGYCLLALDRAAEAKQVLVAAWQVLASTPQAAETAEAAGAAVMLGLARTRTGEAGLAEAGLRQAIAVREKAFGPDNPRTHNARSVLGECLVALGRAAEAEPLLVVAEAALAKAYGENHRETKAARARRRGAREALARPAGK